MKRLIYISTLFTAVGLAFPFSVLAIFSGAIHTLPRSGDWMLWVRKLMG